MEMNLQHRKSGNGLVHPAQSELLWSRLQSSLLWLDGNLQRFDPLPSGFSSYKSLKRFAELSIVLMCLDRLAGTGNSPAWLQNWVGRVSEFQLLNCRRPAYQESIVKDQIGAYSFALPVLVLRGMGHRCIGVENEINKLLSSGLLLSVEMTPFRALDRLYFLSLGGLRSSPPELTHWYSRTTLGARRQAFNFNLDDAYSITHTVFYAYDFGGSNTLMNHAETQRILVVLHSLLVHSWRLQNWDLMGEVLGGISCLRIDEANPFVREAESAYLAAYRGDGTIPPNRIVARRQRKIARQPARTEAEAEFYFQHCYHSTLVFLLFASMRLSHAKP